MFGSLGGVLGGLGGVSGGLGSSSCLSKFSNQAASQPIQPSQPFLSKFSSQPGREPGFLGVLSAHSTVVWRFRQADGEVQDS